MEYNSSVAEGSGKYHDEGDGMNCIKHPETPAAGTCAGCAEPFCNACLVTIKNAKYCADCKGLAVKKDVMAGAGPVGSCEEASSALKYAIVSLFCIGFILGPIAIIKGFSAKKIIAANPRLEGGGKATAAIIIGIISTVLNILGIIAKFAIKD